MQNFATVLTPEQVVRVHQASLEILEKVGLLVRNPQARQIFARHGCRVDEATEIVRLPAPGGGGIPLLDPAHLHLLRPRPQVRQDPAWGRTGDGHRVSAPNIIDPLTGYERRATSEDLARIAHLVNALPGHDVFSISTLAEDAPAGAVQHHALLHLAQEHGQAGARQRPARGLRGDPASWSSPSPGARPPTASTRS